MDKFELENLLFFTEILAILLIAHRQGSETGENWISAAQEAENIGLVKTELLKPSETEHEERGFIRWTPDIHSDALVVMLTSKGEEILNGYLHFLSSVPESMIS